MNDETFTLDAPPCPQCGGATNLRDGKFGQFWGCNSFPRCRGLINVQRRPDPLPPRSTQLAGPIQGSPEQEAIWEAITSSRSHLVIRALAGTGKSFTCRHGMQKLPPTTRVLYLAFNKSICQEFSADAPRNAEVRTLNSIGYRVVKNAFPNVLIDGDKVSNLLSEIYEPVTPQEVQSHKALTSAVESLVNLCQGYLVDGWNGEEILELAAKHEVEIETDVLSRVLSLVPRLLELSKQRTSVVSFNDQMWLPVVLNLPFPKYDVIFVDEAQDLNALNHQLVLRLLAPSGRVVVVGDDNQAIYGFRGSDVDSINNFCKLLQATGTPIQEFPLTVTRRCPKQVVEQAQSYVPEFQAMPSAPEGKVVHTDTEEAEGLYKPGDMVLCRCNAPLTGVAFRLIRRGVKAVVRGRDIGQGLIALVQKLRPTSINDLRKKLDQWLVRESAKVAGTKREEQLVAALYDKHECLTVLTEDANDVSELLARVTSIFENFEPGGAPRNAVVLSSIHRAKGLEAKRVFWLMPELTCKANQDWQFKQEQNLHYVAITRSMSELYYVADASKSRRHQEYEIPTEIQPPTRGEMAAELATHGVDADQLEMLCEILKTPEAVVAQLMGAGTAAETANLCGDYAHFYLKGR